AIRMLEAGVASAEDIDRAMELGYNHPMGPLRLTDLVGLDVRLRIAEYLASTLGPRFEPPQLLRDLVAQGKLGKKTGEGFYRWSAGWSQRGCSPPPPPSPTTPAPRGSKNSAASGPRRSTRTRR